MTTRCLENAKLEIMREMEQLAFEEMRNFLITNVMITLRDVTFVAGGVDEHRGLSYYRVSSFDSTPRRRFRCLARPRNTL